MELQHRNEFLCEVNQINVCESNEEDPFVPAINPIKTLQDLLQWEADMQSCTGIARVALRSSSPDEASKPKTLICHDMKGGYLEDKFPQGFDSFCCYNFQYWNYIDTFVYFSHNLATIPPPTWTNAAHTHGVKCLGTFITEWNDGSKICNEFLVDENRRRKLIDQLVDMALFYNFDGWLLNIENCIEQSSIEKLVVFVKDLTQKMTSCISHAQVIWYDSVTVNGDLKWQNELNSLNLRFFDACSGIFLNYTWKEENLKSSAESGYSRMQDIYVGVDVFGRGCFGGGGYSTYKAMREIRKYGLSAAIFAPGWVFECHEEADFRLNQKKFWELILPYLYTHNLNALPLSINFCQGQGQKFYIDGVPYKDKEWTNLSCQSLQCCTLNSKCMTENKNVLNFSCNLSSDIAYEGGGCCELEAEFVPGSELAFVSLDLIKCRVTIISELYVSLSTMLMTTDAVDMYVVLQFSQTQDLVFLLPYIKGKPELQEQKISDIASELMCGNSETYNVIVPKFIPKAEIYKEKKHSKSGWQTAKFVLSDESYHGKMLEKVKIILSPADPSGMDTSIKIYLGKFCINKTGLPLFPHFESFSCSDTIFVQDKYNKTFVSLTLGWLFSGDANLENVKHFDVFCTTSKTTRKCETNLMYIGRAFCNVYRVLKLEVTEYEVTFIIQPVTYCYVRQPISDCPHVNIKLKL